MLQALVAGTTDPDPCVANSRTTSSVNRVFGHAEGIVRGQHVAELIDAQARAVLAEEHRHGAGGLADLEALGPQAACSPSSAHPCCSGSGRVQLAPRRGQGWGELRSLSPAGGHGLAEALDFGRPGA